MEKRKTLMFKKVKDEGRLRFYKLSEPVEKVPNPNYNWEVEREKNKEMFAKGYEYLNPQQIEYVSISDALYHKERLMFVAFYFDAVGESYIHIPMHQIDGKHTNSLDTEEVCLRDVHPDEVYLRRLASSNNMNFKMEE